MQHLNIRKVLYMNRSEFQELVKQGFLYLDGATGSNLLKRGMPSGVCPEEWVLSNQEVLISLQKEYVAAGSNILYAPTFSGNRIKLKEYGLDSKIESINTQLVALSKEAAGNRAYIAGDLTMTGEQLSPIGTLGFEDLINVYKEQIIILEKAGVDLLVVETMTSLQETRAALIAAREVSNLPIMATMTFEEDGRALYGTDAVTAAVVLKGLGACAVGVNCSTGPDKMVQIVQKMAQAVELPIIAKPNAGLPSLTSDGQTVYSMDEKTFGQEMVKLVQAGASILGGCCGTAPEYIRELTNSTKCLKPRQRSTVLPRYLTSERRTLRFGLDDSFIVIGERINPTGKKKLQAELKEGRLDLVETYTEEQEACGASVLDINLGMSGIDEKEMMLRTLELVTGLTSLPLSLDSSHAEVLEAALRRYPGRALLNSVSGETAKTEKLLQLAKKYGAMFILLPLSDEGLPKSFEEKKQIIDRIVKRALEIGLCREDILVDGLVTTVGADKKAALETLETIRYCKQEGLATTCGLSNISFGLPERGYVNTAFLTMAIQAGLTSAIANPSQKLLMSLAFASDLLLNKQNSDVKYIEYINSISKNPEESGIRPQNSQGAVIQPDILQQIGEAVLKGRRNHILPLVEEAIRQQTEPSCLLNQVLLPAISQVGTFFEEGSYFLPQLIAGAETMKKAIEYLEPMLMQENRSEAMPVIVIATVKGDIHDIGKNLVALMLKNHGFQVIDLGKDVPKETILKAAIDYNASVIALSALMTTTMQEMRTVIQYAKEQNVSAKIIIGGAVITQEYADEIHADGYSKDAADAVNVVKQILGIEI